MKGLYPEESIPFSLPIHKSIDEAKRPTFLQRFLTARQRIRIATLIDEAARVESSDPEASFAKLFEALDITLAGWRNVTTPDGKALPFTAENLRKLPDLLDAEDLWSLYVEGNEALKLKRVQLRNFASPSPSDTGSSVPSVA